MLNELIIENIALIERLSVNFGEGLNILSGETGAGKSIIIDSLTFVLGRRADKSLIRHGADSATVSACFASDNCGALAEITTEFGIEFDGEIILKRSMTLDGKNVCRINGEKVTLAMLKRAASALADVYGQHENTRLLDDSSHLEFLDAYAQNELSAPFARQRIIYDAYCATLTRLNEYGDASALERERDLLEYQITELTDAALREGEEDELVAMRRKFNNAQGILEALGAASNMIDGSDDESVSAVTSLSAAIGRLEKIADFDARIDGINERLDSAKIELEDIFATLSEIADECEFSPEDALRCEERLYKIRSVTKKYGGNEAQAIAFLEKSEARRDFLAGGEEALINLTAENREQSQLLYQNTTEISRIRRERAADLSAAIKSELAQLGMKHAEFVVNFADTPPCDDCVFTPTGSDSASFYFSANADRPPMPLSKIISGGELSRFMLAIKNIIADLDGIDTMVFDEIDTGISGSTAQAVAEKLYGISRNRQVLAVTHLPQLASFADCHYLIEKSVGAEGTLTSVTVLDYGGSLAELARLLGGKDYSTYALPHAEEMKKYADDFKSKFKK